MGLTKLSITCSFRKGWAVMAVFLGIGLPSTLLAASPLLRCEISQGGETFIEDFLPNSDPYGVEAKDINGEFRFKAVLLGNEQLIESIKIYTYYKEQHQVVLLHEAQYMPPFPQSQFSSAALTGVNYLYSPDMERELQYGCTLLEAPP